MTARPRLAHSRSHADDRKRDLAAIHAAAAQLGMDTADKDPGSAYRQMLLARGGATSAAALDADGRRRVLRHLRSCLPRREVPKDGWHGQLIKDLWAQLGAVGALNDPSEAGLMHFVRRFTGVSALRFLPPREGNQVVEGLKGWLARAKAAKAWR